MSADSTGEDAEVRAGSATDGEIRSEGRQAKARRAQGRYNLSYDEYDRIDSYDDFGPSHSSRHHKNRKEKSSARRGLRSSQKPSDLRNMGQENSTPIDPMVPPTSLKGRDLESVAEHITCGNAKKIVVMSGAGISTSAGIPDFRSPGTGLYANLARLNLPYAEAVFSVDYFREKPEAFYTLAQELWPGKWRPTITHVFIALLHKKGLLLKHFTQNIDCLDREAGVPGDKVIEAHGSFATSRCIDCKSPYSNDELLAHVERTEIPRCHTCKGLVKPDIVFFGEALPAAFFAGQNLLREADLVIVLGSSLSVAPFAQLPGLTSTGVPRLLVNNEIVGDLGTRADDVIQLGDCDDGIRRLAKACDWLDELEDMWNETGKKFGFQPVVTKPNPRPGMSRDEKLEDEVNKIAQEVEDTLHVTKIQTDKVMSTQAKPRISQPQERREIEHSRVKSVEEWKSEFLAKYKKDLKHESEVESGARERARIAARSSPLPAYHSDKTATAVKLDGAVGEGGGTVDSALLSHVQTTSMLTRDPESSRKGDPSPPLFAWTDPDKNLSAESQNDGHLTDGTPSPSRWNEDSPTMMRGTQLQHGRGGDGDEDDGESSLAASLKQ
ncbi:hypothetical protein FKW77_005511 [Venturia effusa]|uniref:Deacetylase sirtuin-type domain-containing protein n=1 Tax=Venturia effusa TaxID=50376 RepID=A0A517LRC6_9PEZI|nr:hypothetical protein FKW77_005511 [Venturia effusa]